MILSHSAHRWWGTGRVMAWWALKLQTVERDLGALGAYHLHSKWATNSSIQMNLLRNLFLNSVDLTPPHQQKITLLWKAIGDEGPLRSTSGKSHLQSFSSILNNSFWDQSAYSHLEKAESWGRGAAQHPCLPELEFLYRRRGRASQFSFNASSPQSRMG